MPRSAITFTISPTFNPYFETSDSFGLAGARGLLPGDSYEGFTVASAYYDLSKFDSSWDPESSRHFGLSLTWEEDIRDPSLPSIPNAPMSSIPGLELAPVLPRSIHALVEHMVVWGSPAIKYKLASQPFKAFGCLKNKHVKYKTLDKAHTLGLLSRFTLRRKVISFRNSRHELDESISIYYLTPLALQIYATTLAARGELSNELDWGFVPVTKYDRVLIEREADEGLEYPWDGYRLSLTSQRLSDVSESKAIKIRKARREAERRMIIARNARKIRSDRVRAEKNRAEHASALAEAETKVKPLAEAVREQKQAIKAPERIRMGDHPAKEVSQDTPMSLKDKLLAKARRQALANSKTSD